MTNKPFSKKLLFTCFILGLIAGSLAACSDNNTTLAPTTSLSNTPGLTPGVSSSSNNSGQKSVSALDETSKQLTASVATVTIVPVKPLVQPKIARTTEDSRRTIQFTEQPDLKDGHPTLLWFDAASCPVCAQMQPVINGLKEQYQAKIKFADLDFYDSKNRGLVMQYRLISHPTFILLDGQGKLLKRWVGLTKKEDLETSFKELVAK
ncbi:MAG TPA: thioredoxin family protein [Chloroflexia bacterium]|nr:thioredoxin family protein [Chloroflexia bacterium]